MTDLFVIPDAERVVVDFYRAQPEVVDLIGDRVYTALPAKPAWPSVRVVRWGGWPLISEPLWLDEAWCQVDTWGGNKEETSALARLLRTVAAARLVRQNAGTVTKVRFGMMHDSPDSSYTPAKPHVRFDMSVLLHPEQARSGTPRPGRPGPPNP